MNIGIHEIATNLGMSFENTILIGVTFGGIIFYAKDVRIGLIMQVLGYALCYIWFRAASLDYGIAIIAMFISIVLMALSLIAVNKVGSQGGFV